MPTGLGGMGIRNYESISSIKRLRGLKLLIRKRSGALVLKVNRHPTSLRILASLVPDAPGPMVLDSLLFTPFQLLHCVIQEKVEEDSIDACTRMRLANFSQHQLHAPDAASCAPS